LTDEEFEKHRESIRLKKAEKDYTLYEEAGRLWNAVSEHNYEFDRKFKDAERIKEITKADFQKYVLNEVYNNPRTFETHVVGEQFKEDTLKLTEERKNNDKTYKEIKSFEWFKVKMPLYPDYFAFE